MNLNESQTTRCYEDARSQRASGLSALIGIVVVVFCIPCTDTWVSAQVTDDIVYEATWESLDSRATPNWFQDAKFGIFIHWGLYSVPAWSPKGTYAEWYWHAKDGLPRKHAAAVARSEAVKEFHSRVYGEDFGYEDFRPLFTCELFNPEQWANIFSRSGARYVVLTSKHHDGYCLWPSAEASQSFGTAWNSVESGPHRDLVGDLTRAVRAEGLKMGLYYSIWDWFNPFWPEIEHPYAGKKDESPEGAAGREKYIHEVMYPQFKELVEKYQPALIFSDGDWWMDDDKWETRPLLAWLYNNAPNKNEVVINDRWGKVRGKHGGYFTTEYGAGFDDPEVLWEENRGIGMSFGFNREESFEDYNSAEHLILMLVDTVSRGGNLLLDVGPTSDGRIPVIMEERLAEIGAWLEINGEAIYGSRRWVKDAQWSAGARPEFTKEDHHTGSALTESTIHPKPGNASREALFTSKGSTLYSLCPGWPVGETLVIRDVTPSDATDVSLLGLQKKLAWKRVDDSIEIDLTNIGINDLPCDYVFAFKLTHIKPHSTED
ncbi:MAG: alpha-L-fucosidase [Pirellulales bacterium]